MKNKKVLIIVSDVNVNTNIINRMYKLKYNRNKCCGNDGLTW